MASPEPANTLQFTVPDMSCSGCTDTIESALIGLDGVTHVKTGLTTQKVTLEIDPSIVGRDRIVSAIRDAGYTVGDSSDSSHAEPFWKDSEKFRTVLSGFFYLLGIAANWGEIALFSIPLGSQLLGISECFLILSAILGGYNFLPSGLKALRTLSLDMNFLMSAAIIGAVFLGEYLEAASIAFLFSLAEVLEGRAMDQARNALRSLMKLAPDVATIRKDGKEVTLPVDEVELDDTILVRPGGKIPLDGVVIKGRAAVDQAPITGESMPVEKLEEDPVFAGTLNQDGFLEIRASRPAQDSTLSKIIRMVEAAEERRAPSEQFVRKFARIYTPVVTCLALLVLLIPTLIMGESFDTWFVRSLTLLVIACPCALVISTPVAVISGITSASRNGVLIKGGSFLEKLGEIRAVAFDKTGTLTHGKPEVTDILGFGEQTSDEILKVAASLEHRSRHPIARSILRRAENIELHETSDFSSLPGLGVRGTIQGEEYVVGKPDLFSSPIPEDVHRLSQEGKTTVLVGTSDRLLGAIALADTVRPQAAAAIQALRSSGMSKIVMLTGDNEATANAIANQLKVGEWRSNLLPEQKVEALNGISLEAGNIAMVGDGVNDAPALATASIGIAMGAAGSDTALETADVALMTDDLSRLPYLFKLSRTSRSVIKQNVWFSILLKLSLALGVFPGFVSLITAIIVGDMGATLAVTANSLRLGRIRPS